MTHPFPEHFYVTVDLCLLSKQKKRKLAQLNLSRLPLLGILLWVFVLSACYDRGGVFYHIKKGDTLSKISLENNIPLEALVKANPRVDPNAMAIGQKILIPQSFHRGSLASTEIMSRTDPVLTADKPMKDTSQQHPSPKKSSIRTTPDAGQKLKQRHQPNASSLGQNNRVKKNDLKFIWPAQGAIVTKFGINKRKMHNGIDIALNDKNIVAAERGVCVYASNAMEGYGNMLILRHTLNVFSVYAYVEDMLIQKGDQVTQGQKIATGPVNSNRFFHFEIRRDKLALDPEQLLNWTVTEKVERL